MVSVKTDKNKNWTPLLRTNFSRQETLPLDLKRFLHTKGPKNVLCLWLRPECGFSRLQNQGVRFSQHAEILLQDAKKFEASSKYFASWSKIAYVRFLLQKNCLRIGCKKLTGCKKFPS